MFYIKKALGQGGLGSSVLTYRMVVKELLFSAFVGWHSGARWYSSLVGVIHRLVPFKLLYLSNYSNDFFPEQD